MDLLGKVREFSLPAGVSTYRVMSYNRTPHDGLSVLWEAPQQRKTPDEKFYLEMLRKLAYC